MYYGSYKYHYYSSYQYQDKPERGASDRRSQVDTGRSLEVVP